jgi:REP element-mobilizing transposase RayT
VVDRRFAFAPEDKEQFRIYMRMIEQFTGCRVLSYCLMCNHFHILLEVTPRPKEPLSDAELLKRLSGLYSAAEVAVVAKELAAAHADLASGRIKAGEDYVQRIHQRYTHRMHDLSEFMKTLLQRFTRWHNTRTKRKGNLWEENFKSVVVEDGEAARTMAAYIDLNPVRAGMVEDPADYHWSSYGEAVGGGVKGNGKRAREGLVRAWMAHKGWGPDARGWDGKEKIHAAYRSLLLAAGEERAEWIETGEGEAAKQVKKVKRKGMDPEKARAEREQLEAERRVALAKRLRWRLRYFSDGAVIGSREFVDSVFEACRDRFGPKRQSGARRMRGDAAALTRGAGLFSLRDLSGGAATTPSECRN